MTSLLPPFQRYRLKLLKDRCYPCPSKVRLESLTVQCSELCGCPDGQTISLLTQKCPKGIEIDEYKDFRQG